MNFKLPKCNLTCSNQAKALSNGDETKQNKNENNFRLNNEYSTKLEFSFPETFKKIPLYRIMDRDGNILSKKQEPNVKIPFIFECKEKKSVFFISTFN